MSARLSTEEMALSTEETAELSALADGTRPVERRPTSEGEVILANDATWARLAARKR